MSDWFDHTNEPIPPTDTPSGESQPPVSPIPPVPPVAPEAPVPPAEPSFTVPAEPAAAAPDVTESPAPASAPAEPAASWTADGGSRGWQQPTAPYGNPYGWNAQPTPPQPPRKKGRGTTVLLAVLSVVCVVSLIVSGVLAVQLMSSHNPLPAGSASGESANTASAADNTSAPTLTINDLDVDDGGLTTKEIVQKNINSTVLIDIYTYVSTSQGGGFWGYNPNGNRSLQKSGCATGIVWTADGYIITNSHCVVDESSGEKFPRIDVTLYDGTVYESAQIIGYDPTSDLAVIKVEANGLSAATFGDSSLLEMGDRVVAIGNPGGLGFTTTTGIISGLERDVYDDAGYGIKCLQTDSAINPGNSGGPLINAAGQIIGINSAKIVSTGYEGLGFAIPINEAKAILDDLVQYHYVTGRVSLGITGYSVTTVGLEGFQIASIEEDSSLVGTGAQVGDIITYVDKTRVTNYGGLRSALASHQVGDTVTLTLLRYDSRSRDISTLTVTCTLGENRG